MKPIVGSLWRHTKTGGVYRIIALGRYEPEPAVELIAYADTKTDETWVRRLDVFLEPMTDGRPRFVALDNGE